MVTTQPRKSRKLLYNLPNHLARRQVSAHLSDDLIKKYDRRSLTVRKGDTVRVLRGEYRGTTGKVLEVDTKDRKVTIEGVTLTKADKTQKPRPIDPSNVEITKLDLTDRLRREKLGEKEAPEAEKPKKEKKAKAAAAAPADEAEAAPAEAEGAETDAEAPKEEKEENR